MNSCPHCGQSRKDYLAPLDYPRAARDAAWRAQFGFSPEAGETDKDRLPGQPYGFFEGTQYQDEYDGQSNPHARIYLTLLGRMNRAAWQEHLADCGQVAAEAAPEIPDWLLSPAMRARDWLKEQLGLGPRPVREIEACGQAAGISYWTLYRAGLALGVKKVRVTEGFSGQGRWLWSLGGAA